MSISSALNNALSGLTAASRMAEVVSSNLANALTEGYGRRQLDLSAQSLGNRGAGVRIDGITRIADRGILADRWIADARLAADRSRASVLSQLETAFGGAGGEDGLAARIATLEQTLAVARSDPSSDIRLSAVLDALTGVADGLGAASRSIQSLRQAADSDIAAQVDSLNTSLRQLEDLNSDIVRTTATGGDASALSDQRQVVVDSIAQIVPVRAIDRPGGQIALVTTRGEVLIDGKAAQYDFARTPTITADMTLASGALSGVTRAGAGVGGQDGVGRLSGGSLGAAFARRDEILVRAGADLDALARDLLERFEDPATDPTRPAGAPGLLTDRGGAFDPLAGPGLAGRVSVNPLIDPNRGGALFRLRDGIGAAAPGPVGNGAQLGAWQAALTASRSLEIGSAARGAAAQAAEITARIGSDRLAADREQSFSAARHGALRETELAADVDSDQEMQLLLRIEQAYAANARVMQTLDSMMQRLMEI